MNVAAPPALNRILETAFALFAESGYDAVSMHAIAERAGVSKANVFHHFGSKQALYNATLNFVCQKSIERVEASLQAEGSYAERLRKWLVADIVHMCEKERQIRIVLRATLEEGRDHGQPLVEKVFAHKLHIVAGFMAMGQKAGEFRRDFDPTVAALQIMAAGMHFILCRDMLRHESTCASYADAPERYAERVCDALLRGALAVVSRKPPVRGGKQRR